MYHQIDRAHREWKEEQIQNLAAIVRLYRGETNRYLALISHYAKQAMEAQAAVPTAFEALQTKLQTGLANLQKYAADSQAKRTAKDGGLFGETKGAVADLIQKLTALSLPMVALPNCSLSEVEENAAQLAFAKTLSEYLTALKATDALLKTHKDTLSELWAEADKSLKIKNDKTWTELELNNLPKALDELYQFWKTATDTLTYWHSSMDWLQSRFPEAKYTDIVGLCKAADNNEYAEEQDYSLNAGRYVGVEVEGDEMSKEDFDLKISQNLIALTKLGKLSNDLEKKIETSLGQLI